MTTDRETAADQVRELSREQGVALLDRQTRRALGMSAEEFIRAWQAGRFDDDPDQPELMRLAALIPFAQ